MDVHNHVCFQGRRAISDFDVGKFAARHVPRVLFTGTRELTYLTHQVPDAVQSDSVPALSPHATMGRGKAWGSSEIVALSQAWAAVAHDDPVGAVAQKPAFFDALHAAFTADTEQAGEPRSAVATRAKWKEIARAVAEFDCHLRAVRAEATAAADPADGDGDDEYTVLMKAIARQNGTAEIAECHHRAAGANGGAAKVAAKGRVCGALAGPGAFEFMSCWQFLRKVPLFWDAYESSDADVKTAGDTAPWRHGASGYAHPAKRARTSVAGGRGGGVDLTSALKHAADSLLALTEAVLAGNKLMAEANALTLFTASPMQSTREAKEYLAMCAEAHVSRMERRAVEQRIGREKPAAPAAAATADPKPHVEQGKAEAAAKPPGNEASGEQEIVLDKMVTEGGDIGSEAVDDAAAMAVVAAAAAMTAAVDTAGAESDVPS
jgi:hypothetical protein